MLKAIAARTGPSTTVGPDGKMTTEYKLLLAATAGTLLGLVLEVVAVSTSSWLLIDLPGEGLYSNATGRHLVSASMGLWRLCQHQVERKMADGQVTETEHTVCKSHDLFPSEEEIQRKKDYDQQYLDYDIKDLVKIDYARTAIAFTIIAMILAVIGHCFAFYTMRRPRYIIKRLTALLHFMTAASLLVLNEVFTRTAEHEQANMPDRIPTQAETSYGFSFILSWIVFCLFVLAGMAFLLLSHKRKAEHADDEDGLEDEPMQLGRR